MVTGYSEDALIEQPAIALFASLGWETANCYDETYGPDGTLGRETRGDAVLVRRLLPALRQLNPAVSNGSLVLALEELIRNRSAMSSVEANREVYRLLKDGHRVVLPSEPDGEEQVETVHYLDWDHPANNDFFLASQFWVTGDMYTRRCDLVGFVNGLPLVLIELKAIDKDLKNAFDDNLTDYKQAVPQLFWYNQLVVLSNGSASRVGTITAEWEHFGEWKRVASEDEAPLVSLETMIRGTCEKGRLLDLVENFVLFKEAAGGLVKVAAKNHQYLGVNAALESLRELETNRGRLGVFWHTQGAGKSFSMIFFAQKVLRKLPGAWTFVVVTDRKELDEQIYKNFVDVGATKRSEDEIHATSSEHLRTLLAGNERYVFTLIQKFRTEQPGERYPLISDRSDIVVITDEAHRSQYDTFALNMRNALPNAAFIGFTGTPLMVGEEKTRQVFGDYVSIYNFRESVEERATVPLYYENRIPEMQLANSDLNEDMEDLLEAAELDEDQEAKLEREFARQYYIITDDDRLETVARDIVSHFLGRGYQGKAMVVSIDKATAVRTYDKVRREWARQLAHARAELAALGLAEGAGGGGASGAHDQRGELERRIAYMTQTDMAVVVSQSQNEVAEIAKRGADITPHRKRMVTEDLATKFKNAADPLRLVFVCAMWMTGFDVPCCSTIYLDKPMRNHTLMQTIARANRVFGDKENGLIVDYVGIFRNLEKALAIYGTGSGGPVEPGDSPVAAKAKLVEELRKALSAVTDFCRAAGCEPETIRHASAGFEKISLVDAAIDALLVSDDSKREFLALANRALLLFRAILPDPAANELAAECALFAVLVQKIHFLTPKPDISAVEQQVMQLLEDSIDAQGYAVESGSSVVDLSDIDFDALRAKLADTQKHVEAERLRGAINSKLAQMVRLNRARLDYQQKFEELIAEYNNGALNIEDLFNQLVDFAQSLTAEEKRATREELTEEELALFDILMKPTLSLTNAETKQVKRIARELLVTLKEKKLVIDWRKKQQARASVKLCIKEFLGRLPAAFTPAVIAQEMDLAFQHIYDSYYGDGKSIYGAAA
jgi:type I restriction enzyme R subunit